MSESLGELRTQERGSYRTRSFGGCATCRTRHIKCDEGRPTCSMCKYFGLKCSGYEKDIFFDFEDSTQEGLARFRRPLLTEEERKRMSDWLVSAIPSKLTLQILSQIDEECEIIDPSIDVEVCRGPFGVFRLAQPQSPTASCLTSDEFSEHTTPPQDLVKSNIDYFAPADITLSPWTQEIVEGILNQSEQISIPSSPNFWDAQEVFDDILIAEPQPWEHIISSSKQYDMPQFPSNAQFNPSPLPRPISPFMNNQDLVPSDAVSLLKHYGTTVITLLTPLRHTKTPWHILFIPHIKNCLAALTLGEILDHASLVAFFGTLAISAFSLGGVSQAQVWLERGKAYKQRACGHAIAMLKSAYQIPKAAKYKSILMALLTMVHVSMFAGERHQTDSYFLEAEKFIRLKGLNRKKSRKVRLLHHCYVFERLFHESTWIAPTNTKQRRQLRKAIEASGLAVHSRDSLTFRLPNWINLDQEMLEVKSQEDGENDLHLERPGDFPPTLYPEIFGIPEPWILLLSLTIRLGKAKDSIMENSPADALSLKDFMNRAKALERRINNLQRPTENGNAFLSLQSSTDRNTLENMLDALQQALVIYFYRRVYDVDAAMLQEKVVGVRECLVQCEIADSNVVHGSAGFIWPAFIAACEAEDPSVQLSFSNWFKISAQRSGLTSFTSTLETIQQIWQEKYSSGGTSVTWLDVMRKNALL